MSPSRTRSVTFRATPPEAFSAIREAARRTGFTFLSSNARQGTAVYTSARVMLNFGEKVRTRITQVAPGTVEVTLSSTPALSVGSSDRGAGADRMADALSGLLPPVQ